MGQSAVLDLTRHTDLLAAVAGRAPSLHNAQPWRLRIQRDRVELVADRTRDVPVADPCGRQRHLSLGAGSGKAWPETDARSAGQVGE